MTQYPVERDEHRLGADSRFAKVRGVGRALEEHLTGLAVS
jgi:hypothetical protein